MPKNPDPPQPEAGQQPKKSGRWSSMMIPDKGLLDHCIGGERCPYNGSTYVPIPHYHEFTKPVEAAQPQPEPAQKLTDMLEPRPHAAVPTDCRHNLLNSTGICAECGERVEAAQPAPAKGGNNVRQIISSQGATVSECGVVSWGMWLGGVLVGWGAARHN